MDQPHMTGITGLSIRRPVAITMAYAIAVMLGVVGFLYLPVDLLPAIEFPRLSVTVDYPNVGPEEMETIVTDPLENALAGVPSLTRMTSRSEEGRSRVTLELGRGTNVDEAANDVRAVLDRLRDDLPIEAEAPSIWKFDPDAQQVVTLSVASTRDLAATTRLLEREIAQRFEQIPGVGSTNIGGGVYREIQVNLRRDRLRAAALTPADVRAALTRENVRLPGGHVKQGVNDLYVRTLGEFRSLDEIASATIVVRDGGPIRVRDVAEVIDGFEETANLAEVNGRPAIRLGLQKQSGANTVAVAARIRAEAERINVERPDLHLTVDSDQSTFIRQSIDNVRSSAIWGGLLAILILYLFLRNGSTTAIVALAIPISITATFGLLYFSGLTLNQMTFGGLALGIGMLVDNAIVVLEQAGCLAREIQRRMERTDGVVEVTLSQREGRPEENLRFDRATIYHLGLSIEGVARAVQTSVGGSRAGYFRDGGEQFPITVRLRPADRLTTQDLASIAVRTPSGEMVPVSALVRKEPGRGPTEIDRIDGQRVLYITADLRSGVALGDAVEGLRTRLADLALPEGFSIVFGGAYEEQEQARRDFVVAILLALALVYMVMAGQFERWLDPLVVMASIPVALVGAVPTLLLTGTTLNVQSVMGLVMLLGIVVNNAIVLVGYVNLKRREEGLDPTAAALDAGRSRLRPILMTTSTTILGLVPLALGWGEGAGLQAALARVVVGGLSVSTLVTLFLVPTLYVSATLTAASIAARLRRSWSPTQATLQP